MEEKVLEGEYIPAEEVKESEPSKASCRPDIGFMYSTWEVPKPKPVITPVFTFTTPAASPLNPSGAATYNPASVYFKDRKV